LRFAGLVFAAAGAPASSSGRASNIRRFMSTPSC
jgi:hypothetical protein